MVRRRPSARHAPYEEPSAASPRCSLGRQSQAKHTKSAYPTAGGLARRFTSYLAGAEYTRAALGDAPE